MISEERLAFLQEQADNMGYTPQMLARMQKEGKKIDPSQGPTIVVTLTELREFLRVYKEKKE